MDKKQTQGRTIYITATPIGNLGDMTQRSLEILREVDFVLCEDTRRSGLLLEHFGIHKKLVSYFAHNEAVRTDQFLPRLLDGESAAIITDAGTPGISDPGARIVDACLEAGIRVCPVPGASAVVSAVSAAGFYSYTGFEFIAFFPRRQSDRIALFKSFANRKTLLVGYESPQRIESLLADLESVIGPDRRICMCRELTKKFETIQRSTIGQLRTALALSPVKGEICLVIEGAPDIDVQDDDTLPENAQKLAEILIKHEMSAKDIRDIVSEFCDVRPKTVYRYVLAQNTENT